MTRGKGVKASVKSTCAVAPYSILVTKEQDNPEALSNEDYVRPAQTLSVLAKLMDSGVDDNQKAIGDANKNPHVSLNK